jgi:hypothetical protein
MPEIHLRIVRAKGDDVNAERVEIRKTLLKTPQLGVAKWSPITAVENQQNAVRFRVRPAGRPR